MKMNKILSAFLLIMLMFSCNAPKSEKNKADMNSDSKIPMQEDGIVRISKIEVYPEYLDEYIAYALEVGEQSLKTEPGVLAMYAMQDKNEPTMVTILEIYASGQAYKQHIESAHFKKYKQGTLQMVKSLELCDQNPLNPKSTISNYIR